MANLLEALLDTAKMVPFLLAAYVLVGFLEHHYGEDMGKRVARVGQWGPVLGALVGSIPQCGFSVLSAALYTKGMLSPGTLLSVFLATSDEAIPILLAHPDRARMVFPLILMKVAIAIPAGLLFDVFFGKAVRNKKPDPPLVESEVNAQRDEALHHAACCAHEVSSRPSLMQALVKHPLRHTLKISAYLLALTVGMNLLLAQLGSERMGLLLQKGSLLQPTVAALIGLIPNCFGSVVLTQFYTDGTLSFGAWVAGLCAGAGLGLVILIRENRNWKDTVRILVALFGTSIAWGMCLQAQPWF